MLARWSVLRSLVLLILLIGLGGCENAWLPCRQLDRWFGGSGCVASFWGPMLPPHSLTVTPDGDVLVGNEMGCTSYQRAGSHLSPLFFGPRKNSAECKRNDSAMSPCSIAVDETLYSRCAEKVSPDGRYVARVKGSGRSASVHVSRIEGGAPLRAVSLPLTEPGFFQQPTYVMALVSWATDSRFLVVGGFTVFRETLEVNAEILVFSVP
jgi:hypothetical protein